MWRSVSRLSSVVDESAAQKVAMICLVEQLAAVLVTGEGGYVLELFNAAPESVRNACRPCLLETEIRCLIKNGQLQQANEEIDDLLPTSDGQLRIALLVLKAAAVTVTDRELHELEVAMRQQMRDCPIHAVQVGEFLFRHCRPENEFVLGALFTDMLQTSVEVGDVISAEYLLRSSPHKTAATHESRGSLYQIDVATRDLGKRSQVHDARTAGIKSRAAVGRRVDRTFLRHAGLDRCRLVA